MDARGRHPAGLPALGPLVPERLFLSEVTPCSLGSGSRSGSVAASPVGAGRSRSLARTCEWGQHTGNPPLSQEALSQPPFFSTTQGLLTVAGFSVVISRRKEVE